MWFPGSGPSKTGMRALRTAKRPPISLDRDEPRGFPAVPHADAVGATQDENEVTWNAALHTG